MDWYIHHVNVPSHDVEASRRFYADVIGLPEGRWRYPPAAELERLQHRQDTLAFFGSDNRGIHVVKPNVSYARDIGILHNPTVGGNFAITVSDLTPVTRRLEASGIPYSDAATHAMAGVHQIYVYEPGMRVLEINQCVGPDAAPPGPGDEHPIRDEPGGWYIHHVNMQAFDVRRSVAFLRDIVGLTERDWVYPGDEQAGNFNRATDFLAVFGRQNRGIHVVKPVASFAAANGLTHNPTIGGHFAITVEDVSPIVSRLHRAGIAFDDAGTYAMAGMRQVYTYDPSMNFVEINQVVGD